MLFYLLFQLIYSVYSDAVLDDGHHDVGNDGKPARDKSYKYCVRQADHPLGLSTTLALFL